MFVEYDFMIVKRISIREMYKRKVQLLVLCDPDSNTELHYLVNYKIDLSKFKRNDKVRAKSRERLKRHAKITQLVIE